MTGAHLLFRENPVNIYEKSPQFKRLISQNIVFIQMWYML